MRRRSIPAALLVLALLAPAVTRAAENPDWSFGVLGGVVHYSDRITFPNGPMTNGPAIGFRLSRAIGPYWRIEGASDLADTHDEPRNTAKRDDLTIGNMSLSVMSQLSEPNRLGVVYLAGGIGYNRYHSAKYTDRQTGTLEAAVGWRRSMNETWSVRVEARNILDLKHRQLAGSNQANQQYWAGLGYDFGFRAKDRDGDGVNDRRDKCPDTPKGATVDANGCPTDADGDGVWDGLDRCTDTPKGATVDASGCPTDTDGDGVWDGLDRCADTPKGATVDANGCPTDADGDGVWDGLDRCANTPAGLKVDADGCPIASVERETELLATGMIRLQNVNFATKSTTIDDASKPSLDEVGVILSRWPQLRIEIGGHTDTRGSDKDNLKLSQARAESVRRYLTERFPGIAADQLTAKGYGESKPLTTKRTARDLARNRRVEFKVLDRAVLKQEIERRGLQKR